MCAVVVNYSGLLEAEHVLGFDRSVNDYSMQADRDLGAVSRMKYTCSMSMKLERPSINVQNC
jgi:hypothetical protein